MDADPREDMCEYLPTRQQIDDAKAELKRQRLAEMRDKDPPKGGPSDAGVRIGKTYFANGAEVCARDLEY